MYHRAKIYYNSYEQFSQIQEAGVTLDHGYHKKNTSFESDFSVSELQILSSLGISYDITINDVKQFYLDQNDPNSPRYIGPKATLKNARCSSASGQINYTTPQNYNQGSMGGFLTYSEMLQELDDMYVYSQANNLNIITPRADNINPSNPNDLVTSEGRYQQWVKISDNPSATEMAEPQILYTAIHHAREPASMQQLIFFMWYLLENYSTDPDIQAIVNNTELYFIPVLNPDGYVYNETISPNGGGLWRKNRRGGYGVDPNRNYSYITPQGNEVWNTAGTSANQTGETYAGTAPFSEPETRAVRYFVESHDFKMALNNHTFSELLLYPFGYADNRPTNEDALFQNISEVMVSQNGYTNQISADLYPAAGDSDDFMYGMLSTTTGATREKVYAMTPEIGSSFWPAASQIEGICKEMMFHNITAAQLVGNYGKLIDESPQRIATTALNIPFSLTRLGLENQGTFTVRIQPISTNITSVGNPKTFNNLSLNQVVTDAITMNLSSTIQSGDIVTYEIILNNGLYDTTQTINKVYGDFNSIFEENVANSNNWQLNGWGISTTEFVSPSQSFTDSPAGNYGNNQNKSIILNNANRIDLTSSSLLEANLTFHAKWNIENNYDYVQVEVSIDNGSSWIPQCGNFTNTGVSTQPANGQPLYDGMQSSWVEENINLSDYLGQQILVRFQMVTDQSVTEDGFYFDDLKIEVIDTTASASGNDLDKLVNIYPNPVQNTLFVRTSLERFNVSIYNVQGQQLYSNFSNKPNLELDYSSYTSGIYFLNISTDDSSKTFKVLKE
ncbi:putative carboxypeptidase [Nonlabens dokdonensis DSW-6]|nr:putative carboxypeptidase [Nonlabens dokdonensis DSW-6]